MAKKGPALNLTVSALPDQAGHNLPEIFAFSGRFWSEKKLTHAEQELSYRRQKGMLNLLLAISFWGLLSLFGLIFLTELSQIDFSVLLPEIAGVVIVTGCIGLNRMGQTLTAAWIFLLTMQILTILYLVSRPDETFLPNLRGASPLMVIPILAAGVIIGPRYSFIFAGLSTASTIVIGLSRAKPGLLFLETPADVLDQLAVAICMFFVMASLAWFFETNFRSLIARLTYQNQTLILTNEELARKQEVEQQVAFQVNNLSKQVSKDFEEQNQQTNQQISAVLKAADTVEELGHSNQTILVAAQQVDNTARQALEVVEEGATSLQTGLQSLEILNVQATNLALALNSLYQRAYQIDQIVVLIESITETTHLLALNATIEAAGAGEFGRRFSVVAKEVQNLANQSRQALDQVHRVVGEVRQAITDSTALSQESLKETANLTGGTRSMQTVLKEIVSRVETTAYLAREISLVLEQQRGATLGVVKSMHHISDISNSLKKNTQHLVQSVSHLNEAVTHLSIVSN